MKTKFGFICAAVLLLACLFTGCASTNILRILPPLVLTKDDVDEFMKRFKKVLKTF